LWYHYIGEKLDVYGVSKDTFPEASKQGEIKLPMRPDLDPLLFTKTKKLAFLMVGWKAVSVIDTESL